MTKGPGTSCTGAFLRVHISARIVLSVYISARYIYAGSSRLRRSLLRPLRLRSNLEPKGRERRA